MFWQVVLAVHIVAVVVAFGVVFAYPLFAFVGTRLDPRAMPWFHRMQAVIGRRLISPGLAVVLIAGIYLASKLHQWHHFYVQWGLAIVVILGALEGGYMTRHEEKLAELAEHDLAAVPAGRTPPRAATSPGAPSIRPCSTASAQSAPSWSCSWSITIYLMTVQAS